MRKRIFAAATRTIALASAATVTAMADGTSITIFNSKMEIQRYGFLGCPGANSNLFRNFCYND